MKLCRGLQMLLVWRVGHHECMTISEGNVVIRSPHLPVLSTEVAIENDGSGILPPDRISMSIVAVDCDVNTY